jgi:lipoprotein-releasing system permease protein
VAKTKRSPLGESGELPELASVLLFLSPQQLHIYYLRSVSVVRFIAARMAGESESQKLSRPVVTIATWGVAVGIALMIIAIAIVTGFQQEVREKVIGFGAHFQIVNADQSFNKESSRLEIQQDFYPSLNDAPGIRHIQLFATKPGIMETDENLQGVVIKGVGTDFDWSFFTPKITVGSPLQIGTSGGENQLMISEFTANRLDLSQGDKVTLYFVLKEGDIRPRNFVVTTLYNTGLKEFDEQFVFVDIAHIQRINQWGIEAQIALLDSCGADFVTVQGLGFGGQDELRYSWNAELAGGGPHLITMQRNGLPVLDTSFTLIVDDGIRSLPDTAHMRIFKAPNDSCYRSESSTSGGSWKYYTGGFEVLIDDYSQLHEMDDSVFYQVPYYLDVLNVTDRNPEIFSWLEMLDLNVDLIIYLMILIAVVNMTSALLIIILERTNMIGMLKAFGMRDRLVVFIFIRHAARIIGRGMLYGNVLGFGLCLLQKYTGLVSLDPETYYVDAVPVKFDLPYLFQIEAITFLVCVFMMLLPALYVAKITPVKAIRFD